MRQLQLHLYFTVLLLSICYCSTLTAQHYWQQKVNHTIDVTLNDQTQSINARQQIFYENNSPDTLHFIWLHLWPNAYSTDTSDFSKQLLNDGNIKFYFSKEEDRGHITIADIKVNGQDADLAVDSEHIDITKLLLPEPLLPGGRVHIVLQLQEKLPYNFSRGGHVGNNYQVTQWYPKPAVYDRKGWHPMPYLEDGEYYSEYGDYDVTIHVPAKYTVGATGDEVQNENGLYRYKINNVHDFAWFASPKYKIKKDTVIVNNKTIEAVVYVQDSLQHEWRNAMTYLKNAVRFYSQKVGVYPFSSVKIASGPASESNGGMEYPTIALIPAGLKEDDLETSIVHEVGHNWFYGILGTNERDHAWMDEGMNSYYENRYTQTVHPAIDENTKGKIPTSDREWLSLLINTLHAYKRDQPIDLPSEKYSQLNYGAMEYGKGAEWMRALEKTLGRKTFDSVMQQYYQQWQFRHPYPEDFQQSVQQYSGNTHLQPLFDKLYNTALIDSNVHKTLKPTLSFNLRQTDKYNYIGISPVPGYNYYDGFMLGLLLHNYQLPQKRFNFLLAPMYAFGSKKIAGAGRLEFNTWHPQDHWQYSVSGLAFSRNAWKNFYDGNDYYYRVTRVVPSVRYDYWGNDFRSTVKWHFLVRTYLIREEVLDSIGNLSTGDASKYTFNKKNSSYYINELKVGVENTRVLYPYSADFSVQQSKQFLRTDFTAKYFFNYTNSKTEGFNARLYAGKFFYLTDKTYLTEYNNQKYNLMLSAPAGSYDYTYSNYFTGRNEQDGWRSQQIMERDGFMKVNMPMSADPIGITDNWAAALNLTADIPKTPLKIFFDLGSYDALWGDNAPAGNFLYDAGIQLTLVNNFVNIYVPLLYSKVYRDYYKSISNGKSYFWRTVSFNINIDGLDKKRRKLLWQ